MHAYPDGGSNGGTKVSGTGSPPGAERSLRAPRLPCSNPFSPDYTDYRKLSDSFLSGF